VTRLGVFVAEGVAGKGGTCPVCDMPIGVRNRIFKYATTGATTSEGNGPGQWVCLWCHQRRQRDLEQAAEDDLFRCSGCGASSFAVVQVRGDVRRWCPECWGKIRAEQGRLP